jgi:23S rRNA (adenine-N6)-dimethyltransferase
VAVPWPWGWHQLDPGWARSLVAEARLPKGALVLDVGAGHGVITEALLDAGARVIAVELHPDRVRVLRDRLGHAAVIVRADASDLRLPRRPYHVVANPPFGTTAALLRRLLQPGSRLVSAHLVLQEQAAVRWCGPHAPAAGRWRTTFEPSLGPRVARSAFSPRPPVSARVLQLRRIGTPPPRVW